MSVELGNILRYLREEKLGCSQKEIAEKLNIDRSTYSNYELGKAEPSYRVLSQLCKLYNVKADLLIDDDAIIRYLAKEKSKELIPIILTRGEELVLNILWDNSEPLNAKEISSIAGSLIPKPAYAKALADSFVSKDFAQVKRSRYSPAVTLHDYGILKQILNEYAYKFDDLDDLRQIGGFR